MTESQSRLIEELKCPGVELEWYEFRDKINYRWTGTLRRFQKRTIEAVIADGYVKRNGHGSGRCKLTKKALDN